MIQSIASTTNQPDFGFANLSRFGPQGSKRTGVNSYSENTASSKTAQPGQLTAEQQQQVEQLKQTDRRVHQHEQAHLAVGRDLVRSGATYSYQIGPDNQRYAVAGEVSIDTSPGRTPEETIPKAQHIRATALAPADPSAQDQSVAAQASRMEGEARMAFAVQQREESAVADQGGTRLYRSVVQSTGENAQVGGHLDFFA